MLGLIRNNMRNRVIIIFFLLFLKKFGILLFALRINVKGPGKFLLIIPMINFDWHPAKEPYES